MAKTKSCFLSIGKIQESNRHPPAHSVCRSLPQHPVSSRSPTMHRSFPLLPPRLPLMSPRESLSAHNEIPMMSSCKHQCQHLLEFGMSVAGHIVILCHVQNAVIHCARRRRKKDWKKNHCHCVVVCLPILLSSVL